MFENQLYDGILPLLESLKQAGKTLAIATSKPEVFAKQILEKFGTSWIGYTKLDRIYKVFYTKEKRRTDMSRKIRRHFTDEFQQQIVDLHNAGRKRSELIKEYDLTPSTFDKWVKQARTTGSFKTVDNLTKEQGELIELRKRNKELKMQLDILMQAAVIMARKGK